MSNDFSTFLNHAKANRTRSIAAIATVFFALYLTGYLWPLIRLVITSLAVCSLFMTTLFAYRELFSKAFSDSTYEEESKKWPTGTLAYASTSLLLLFVLYLVPTAANQTVAVGASTEQIAKSDVSPEARPASTNNEPTAANQTVAVGASTEQIAKSGVSPEARPASTNNEPTKTAKPPVSRSENTSTKSQAFPTAPGRGKPLACIVGVDQTDTVFVAFLGTPIGSQYLWHKVPDRYAWRFADVGKGEVVDMPQGWEDWEIFIQKPHDLDTFLFIQKSTHKMLAGYPVEQKFIARTFIGR